MRRAPTDLKILKRIYEKYYESFASYRDDDGSRDSKIYVPIDIGQLGDEIGIDPDIIFGRLYYHLNRKYGYRNDDGSIVQLFVMKAGNDLKCVHFPYVASVLADLQHEHWKFKIVTGVAISALIISLLSIYVSTRRPVPSEKTRVTAETTLTPQIREH